MNTTTSARAVIWNVTLLVAASTQATATDRPAMVGPSAAEEAVKTIVESLQVACNRRDVIGFLKHFTPHRVGQIRHSVENLFICHQMELDVHEAFLLSSTKDEVVFGVRYGLRDGLTAEHLFASRVTAKKVGDSWLLDTEEILSRKQANSQSATESGAVAGPQGGLIPCPRRPDWIPRDIGWEPVGCANGRCGL